ncbi:MAG: hypothetical protein RL235_367, partial [Chlamydiota bacterium]
MKNVSQIFASSLAALDRWVWWKAARPKTWPAALAPVIAAGLIALKKHPFDGTLWLLALAFAWLLQVGANYANDYYDFLSGVDNENRIGPERVLVTGVTHPDAMRRAFQTAFALAFLIALPLIASTNTWGWVVVALSIGA